MLVDINQPPCRSGRKFYSEVSQCRASEGYLNGFFFPTYFSSVKNWLTFDTELIVNSALILHGNFCCSPGRKSLCKMKDRTQSRAGAYENRIL